VRVLSGIQPSGDLHLGNYFGAIKQQIELQDKAECFFFIADYHALTTLRDAEALRRHTREVAAAYLALGLDPDKAVLFRQSDLALAPEMAWILGCCTGVGQFMRAHAYKDKVDQGLKPNMGLFSYPLLMAADILLFKATHVPVGQDQIQHLEMTCDIAGGFNAAYGGILVKPQVLLSNSPYVPGTDGRKMSKSYGNTIPIFPESPQALKKIVAGIVTDSKNPRMEPLDPDTCNAFAIYKLLAPTYADRMAVDYRTTPQSKFPGYGHTKKHICSALQQRFGAADDRYHQLLESSELDDILRVGAVKAKLAALDTLQEVQESVGLRRRGNERERCRESKES
jgi:tryptophanyl-tRNA synthetase